MEYISYSVEDRVAIITLNRPDIGNAFSKGENGKGGTYREVIFALDSAAEDENVGAILLRAEGKNFCVGGGIDRFKGQIEDKTYIDEENLLLASRMPIAIRRCPKPVICAVNGAAAGGGTCIPLASDFRFMTPRSKLILSFINLGLSGDVITSYCLQRLIGLPRTIDMLMTAAPLTGEEAAACGAATLVEREEELYGEAFAFAKKLAQGPILAYAAQKELINECFYDKLDLVAAIESRNMSRLSRTDDFAAAVYAFLDKRKPEFTGK